MFFLKDNANYLWNDKYSFSQAGTPYDSNNQPQNIYELDTVFMDESFFRVPEPSSALHLAIASLAVAFYRRKRG